MNLEEALRIAAQAIFLWVAFITLLIWLHARDRTRRDIFFVFLSFTVAIIAQELALLFPQVASLLTAVLLISILAQPYLVLRVARYLLPVSAPMQRAALAGLLVSAASVLFNSFAPSITTVLVLVYFLVVEGYATYHLVRGARSLPGISGRRLGLAAIGSGLLVIVFLIALLPFLWPSGGDAPPAFLSIILRLLTILAGLSYYMGFAPPRWLRRAWQQEELQTFLHRLSSYKNYSLPVLDLLASAGMRVMSAAGVLVARSNPAGDLLTVQIPDREPFPIRHGTPDPGVINQTWHQKSARLVYLSGNLEPQIRSWAETINAQSLYLVPVIGSTRSWGMMIVALAYLPLFAEDDLALLELFCEQSVVHLDHDSLVERLEATNLELQERVAEQSHTEEKFRRLLESAPDGMVIVDEDCTIVMSNAQAGHLFGYEVAELTGRPLELLFPPEYRRLVIEKHSALMKQTLAHPVILEEDIKGLKRDGKSQLPLEISFNHLSTEEGVLTIVAIHDLTLRYQAEKKFRGLLESAPDAVIVVDEHGAIQLVNSQAEKLFGYERAEMLGKSIEILVPQQFRKRHVRHREGYNIEHPTRPMGAGLDLYAVRKNGSDFPVEISLSPLELQEGLLVSAAIRDITQRKQIEEEIRQLNADLQQRASQLEAANKELESFSYSVSHDLRAPLRSIDGFSQALLEDYGAQLPEEARGYLQRVRSAAQRMAELIDDLLNLSRVTRASLRPRFMNLSHTAEEVISRLREQDPQRNVEVSITPDMMVNGDPHLLQIVMENLLSNAWKFSSRRELAKIEFSQKNHSGERTFFVRDNGVGFNMAYADKLFGVFQRLHSISDYPGTGVGLATVQRIINIHGGRIWAESTEGKGTTFFFTL